ncbi:lantibiotic dehydratase [Halalkalibacterium halodurans]|uniref:lantibiotic dehydratase n=1 Tax=Halalkalibacterium halodurans TaxID=86665 RepID=UPI002E1B35BF|nr:lantibiotic dehydratase [Halalkalibacterium halodurans]MED4086065.1 lantibiotic dehydratase [Halalkalibacterium halodurans]MED4106778.1 lantibiotic dehydratase [Halalkalibacterium halodurans]MED4109535.1 lantibiotic dehydratase [Halalkalibacterium halodurans]MED4149840.1 lantibiotic dehydratase [Halalkalibacterium halodurans]
MPTSKLENHWKLMNRFVLRTTGFPFAFIEKLNVDRLTNILENWLQIEEQKEILAKQFLHNYFDNMMDWEWRQTQIKEQQYVQVKKVKKYFIQRSPLPNHLFNWWQSRSYPAEWLEFPRDWNRLFQIEEQLLSDGEQQFNKEFIQKRVWLKELSSDPLFQEAVFLSSPSAHEALKRHVKAWETSDYNGPKRNKDIRKNELLIYSYLQRFCTKNDTTSFFGPINFGQFDPTSGEAITVEHTEEHKLQQRASFLSQWCVREMARKISQDPSVLPYISPRKNPLVRVRKGLATYHFIGKEKKLPSAYLSLLERIDGQTTPEELSKSLNMSLDTMMQMLKQLEKAGIIRHELELCATRIQQLEDLKEMVNRLPEHVGKHWRHFVEEAIHLRHNFEKVGWPDRMKHFQEAEKWLSTWYEEKVRRKEGKLYGDRLIITEDCVGSVKKLTIGHSLYQRIYSEGALLLEFLKIPAALRWLDYQTHALEAFEKIRRGRQSIAYSELIQIVDQRDNPFTSIRVKEFEQRASSLLTRTPEGYALLREHVEDLLQEYQPLVDQVFELMPFSLPSPDLMIVSKSPQELENGQFQIVVGEIHDDWSTIYDGVFGYFHPETTTLKKELQAMICSFPIWRQMSSVVSNRRHKHITPELPGWTIELASKSIKSQDKVIPMSEVEIARSKQFLTLRYQGQNLFLYPGDVRTVAHGAFSLPRIIPVELDSNEHAKDCYTDRIYLGNMVYQRKRWKITCDQVDDNIPSGFDLMKAGQKFKSRYGLPTQFFVKWKETEKPVFVDVRNYWALDWLFRTMKKTSTLELVEFLPNGDSLWWHGENGPQTCELRMGFTYSHKPFSTFMKKLEGDVVSETI